MRVPKSPQSTKFYQVPNKATVKGSRPPASEANKTNKNFSPGESESEQDYTFITDSVPIIPFTY